MGKGGQTELLHQGQINSLAGPGSHLSSGHIVPLLAQRRTKAAVFNGQWAATVLTTVTKILFVPGDFYNSH